MRFARTRASRVLWAHNAQTVNPPDGFGSKLRAHRRRGVAVSERRLALLKSKNVHISLSTSGRSVLAACHTRLTRRRGVPAVRRADAFFRSSDNFPCSRAAPADAFRPPYRSNAPTAARIPVVVVIVVVAVVARHPNGRVRLCRAFTSGKRSD